MEHERFLLGKDPTDIEFLWQSMFRVPRWRVLHSPAHPDGLH